MLVLETSAFEDCGFESHMSYMKYCTGCELEKPETDFSFKNKGTGKRHTRCKSCADDIVFGVGKFGHPARLIISKSSVRIRPPFPPPRWRVHDSMKPGFEFHPRVKIPPLARQGG